MRSPAKPDTQFKSFLRLNIRSLDLKPTFAGFVSLASLDELPRFSRCPTMSAANGPNQTYKSDQITDPARLLEQHQERIAAVNGSLNDGSGFSRI